MNSLPYVISASLECVDPALLRPKAVDAFREDLDANLRSLGKETVWVDATTLRRGMNELCNGTRLPVVSLDDRYVAPDKIAASLGISRAVDRRGDDAGYDARLGSPDVARQLDALAKTYAGREIVVVDDVLFSGEMMNWLIGELAARNITVGAFGCGIAVGEGAEKLESLGIAVNSTLTFNEVNDELVELDFTTLPGSGRKVAGEQLGSLYFDADYGRPAAWASIPQVAERDFCIASLRRNLGLLQPDVPMGAFVGYAQDNAGAALSQRLQEVET